MPSPVSRPENVVTNLDGTTWRVLIPSIANSSNVNQRNRHGPIGGHVYNADNAAATFILRLNDGTTQTEIARVTLSAQYYRYIFDDKDTRDLGNTQALEISLTGAASPSLIAIARYVDD